MSIKLFYLAALVAVAGCASTGSLNKTSHTSYTLSAAEIADAHADNLTAYDAVARLRPNWLASHGVTSAQGGGSSTEYAIVFLDGQQLGDVNTLRNIQAYQVGDMHYYNVTEAGARYGIRAGAGGAIEVTMKSPMKQ